MNQGLTAAQVVCCAILVVYALRVLIAIIRGHGGGGQHRMREAMALGYTLIAAYFIFSGSGAIRMFAESVLATGRELNVPEWTNTALVVCATIICAAFLCNFSRSLWMLKSLDHGLYEPIDDWGQLTARRPVQQFLEFLTRTCAAVLFIKVELELEELAHHSELQNLEAAQKAQHVPDSLSAAGGWGVLLYSVLLVWWCTGWLIARGAPAGTKAKMPPWQALFFGAGLFDSAFIRIYGSDVVTMNLKYMMLLIVLGMGAAALFMLAVVARDIIRFLRDLYRFTRRKPGEKVPRSFSAQQEPDASAAA